MSDAPTPMFYMLDTRAVVGNCAMWWAKDRQGYTCDLDKAHLFSEQEIATETWRDTDVPVPAYEVRAEAQRHCRVDSLTVRLSLLARRKAAP